MAKKRLQKKKAAAAATKKEQTLTAASTPVSDTKSDKTEPARVETKKTEPIKVETKKVEPVKVETKKVEPVKVETKKVDPVKVETKKVDPVKVETKKVEPVKVETKKVDPIKVETKKVEPVKVETKKVDPIKVETKKVDAPKLSARPEEEAVYQARLSRHLDELKWLYCELYQDNPYVAMHLNDLLDELKNFYDARNTELKASDLAREKDPTWYKRNDLTGMMMYVNSFAGTLKGLESKLDYVQECNVNYLHLMPLLASPKGRSDGGYAVADFRSVQEELGTMEDFSHVTAECHKRGINVCLDFVMNHTSEDHQWAKRARAGEKEYQDRYFFFDSYDVPEMYEKTCPQVFPTTAPGNFTWLEDVQKHVMTTFYPYQWDLNYRNPVVLNEMVFNMLYLANQGVDIVRLDAVPYIWKQLGTNCRNLPQVHTIVRIMRMICEIVCPGVLLLGEVVMAPEKVVPYFGTVEKPECHLLYNVTTMASIWHTVATRDVSLLRRQLDIVAGLPRDYVFQNYLRCHDDIGWGLDYDFLESFGIQEIPHKKYLNDFLTGSYQDSFARGELYNDDPRLGDARLCGTTASLCGIERFGFEGNEEGVARGIRYDITLHAFMLSQSGIPVIYSGDEIGQLNDYSYKNDPEKAADSRYLHRGNFNWDLAENRHRPETVQGKLFPILDKLEKARKEHSVFNSDVAFRTIDTWDSSILALVRENDKEKFIGIYNFSEYDKVAWINEEDGMYTDLISGREMEARGVQIPAFGCFWLCRKK
ncbi:MAG: alpha-amylase family glycosyl hydrolase [Blautia sp.]|uniref:alpha-amylase family glycosyl hydrolase n=1 Tax=Blautia sp. TaxID=1955243 RepID=UPI002A765760|nr:alpha-amylase family glycosyl hydrolase [Blautia sp.]MDY3018101.1 alpha-amylase family glycosyl hydrolase [Blautia sp.]